METERDEAPAIIVSDGGKAYRSLVANLRSELCEGRPGTFEAAQIVRGLVRRITIGPGRAKIAQPIEVQAGIADDCTGGCGGWI